MIVNKINFQISVMQATPAMCTAEIKSAKNRTLKNPRILGQNLAWSSFSIGALLSSNLRKIQRVYVCEFVLI